MARLRHRKYNCPLCRHALTAAEYERVLGIQQTKEKELRDMRDEVAREKKALLQQSKTEREALRRERASLTEQKRDIKSNFDKRLKIAVLDAQTAEKKKAETTTKRFKNIITKLQRENEHLHNATNQSEVGRAWDGKMADFIAEHFRPLGDHVEPTPGSRKGDIIYNIRHNGETVCPIIIENKTGLVITAAFIRQTSMAKRDRKARYALLVSDGRRAGFEGGIKIEKDVILVRPAALISLLSIIRTTHIELARSKASDQRIDDVSKNLKAFVQGENFRTPIDAIVKAAADLDDHLRKERVQVDSWWKMRERFHAQIGFDGAAIRTAVQEILGGKVLDAKIMPFRRARRAS